MGSEQSSQHGKSIRAGLRRGKSVPNYHPEDDNDGDEDEQQTGTISPEPSICSDSDLPYISYTVNRPIGDSPKKKPTRRLSHGKSISGSSSIRRKKKIQLPVSSTGHDIVVVKEAVTQPSKLHDPDLIKLHNIPMFLPIMRATLSVPAARDPEVLERLDSTPLCNLCHLYQNVLKKCATEIHAEQEKLTKQIAIVDRKSSQVLLTFHEKQKTFAKNAEKLNKIHEIVQSVDRCNKFLKETIYLIQIANDALPDDLKLESFVWTTG